MPGNNDIERTVAEDAWRTLRRDLPQVLPQDLSRWMANGPAPFGVDHALREAILSILSNPTYASRLAHAGRERAETAFCLPNLFEAISAVLKPLESAL